PFAGRTAAHDSARARRERAAAAWIDEAFARARAARARGIVLVMHADIGLDPDEPREGYGDLAARLAGHAAGFPGIVLLVHGDSHTARADHPLRDSGGRVLANVTRIESFGSPEIGWMRVVLDTVAGRLVRVEPRLMRGL